MTDLTEKYCCYPSCFGREIGLARTTTTRERIPPFLPLKPEEEDVQNQGDEDEVTTMSNDDDITTVTNVVTTVPVDEEIKEEIKDDKLIIGVPEESEVHDLIKSTTHTSHPLTPSTTSDLMKSTTHTTHRLTPSTTHTTTNKRPPAVRSTRGIPKSTSTPQHDDDEMNRYRKNII